MLRLDLTDNAAGFVTSLEAKKSRQVWNKIIGLMKNPRPHDSIDLGEGFFRTDIGENRVVYKFDKEHLYITLIGKRNDNEVYRDFKNKK